jgi:hypothetical protein
LLVPVPELEFLDRAVEVLHFDRAGSLVDGDHLEELLAMQAIPLTDCRLGHGHCATP